MRGEDLKHYEIEISNLRKKVQSSNLNNGHQECKKNIQRFQKLIETLKQTLKKEVSERDRLLQQLNFNPNAERTVVHDLWKFSPQVQKLQMQNFTLKSQLKNNYMNPQSYFHIQQKKRIKEEEEQKQKQIKQLKKKLAQLKKESAAQKQRGSQLEQLYRYERLLKQNQQLKEFLSDPDNSIGDNPILGTPEAIHFRQANKVLFAKLQQFQERIHQIQSQIETSNINTEKLIRQKDQLTQKYQQLINQQKRKEKYFLEFQRKYKEIQLKYTNLQKMVSEASLNSSQKYQIKAIQIYKVAQIQYEIPGDATLVSSNNSEKLTTSTRNYSLKSQNLRLKDLKSKEVVQPYINKAKKKIRQKFDIDEILED